MKEQKIREKPKVLLILEDIIFYIILIPLITINVIILFQVITEPDKIPDIFGYKMFMVLDGNMDTSIEYGDLVFTKNVYAHKLKVNDVVAFRNHTNKVTIHRISNKKIEEEDITFTMITAQNEVGDTKYVKGEQVEGILIHRIPKIGLIILIIQEPPVMVLIVCVILIIGLIAYYIAQELDKRDAIRLENQKEENAELQDKKQLTNSIK